jgi:hypothetical protein
VTDRVEWLGETADSEVTERSFLVSRPSGAEIGPGAPASGDKRLVARSGPHAKAHPGDETSWLRFIARSPGLTAA